MNQLALPAPKVEAAFSSRAPDVEAATTNRARVEEPGTAEPAQSVEAAALFDPKVDAPRPKETLVEKGISVRALRGENGADFESIVAVLRGAPEKNFLRRWIPCCFDERDFISFGEVKRFVVIKGNCCFVFTEETDVQPIYAIPLDEVRPFMEDPSKPEKTSVTVSPTSSKGTSADLVTVLLRYHDGAHAYQFTFDASNDRSVAKRFYDAVERASKADVTTVTASITLAKTLGQQAAKAQPEKP